MTYFHRNIEGLDEFDLDPELWKNRRPGLSAMLRLANEEEFIGPCIESIIGWVDEIVCTLQESTDRTEDILREYNSSKIFIYRYPFKSHPNGPGHDQHRSGSVYERAYFYNWSLCHTSCLWVVKWDGDMVAVDWLGKLIREIIKEDQFDVICCDGVNIVQDLKHMSLRKPYTAREPRFFRVIRGVHYFSAAKCEDLCHPSYRRGAGYSKYTNKMPNGCVYFMTENAYLHFKWAKKPESAHIAWPKNWDKIKHFQLISDQALPGKKYRDELPRSLRGIMGCA